MFFRICNFRNTNFKKNTVQDISSGCLGLHGFYRPSLLYSLDFELKYIYFIF